MFNNLFLSLERDLITLLIALFFILVIILLSEILFKKNKLNSNAIRKLVHVIIGGVASFTPYIFISNIPQIFLAILFMLINFIAINNNFLNSIHSIKRKSYGTIFFPFSFLTLSIFFWNYQSYFLLSFLILSLSDPIASLVGENLKSASKFYIFHDKKTIQGSTSFFIVSFIIIFVGSSFTMTISLASKIFFSIFVSLGATIAEASSSKGSDNFSIPIISILFMISYEHRFVHISNILDILNSNILMILILMAIMLLISHKLKLLSISGFLGATLMGTLLIMFKGINYILIFIIFFILSSMVSKIFKKENLQNTKGSNRDIIQVYSNGGVALLICIYDYFIPNEFNILLFSSSIAAAMSDTWGTEFGKISKSKPKLITSMKNVNHGESGGVTFVGTIASFLGASVIGLATNYLFHISQKEIILIILSGFLASIIDSILGATLQGRFKSMKTDRIIELDLKDTIHISGLKWMTNDVVNIVNTSIAPFIYFIIHLLLK